MGNPSLGDAAWGTKSTSVIPTPWNQSFAQRSWNPKAKPNWGTTTYYYCYYYYEDYYYYYYYDYYYYYYYYY